MNGSVAFRFQEALRELHAFNNLAKFFVAREEAEKLMRFRAELESFQNANMKFYRWQIPREKAIRTRGAASYEPDSKGHHVYATLSCVWEIEKMVDAQTPAFRTTGLASTTIKVFRAETDTLISEWNMELGDELSPGCHFHAQLGNSTLPIPRLPTLAVTPAAAMEFALAELFQEEWPTRAGGTQPGAVAWRRVQRNRILCFLQWMENIVQQSVGSPWSEYKAAKPPLTMFMSDPKYNRH